MTTIARINTSISDHDMVAKSAALFVIACISVFSAVVTIHTGNLVTSSYNTLLQSSQAAQAQVNVTPTGKVQSNQQTPNIVLGDTSSTAAQLQPAQGMAYYKVYSTVTLQPNTNGVQHFQDASSIQ